MAGVTGFGDPVSTIERVASVTIEAGDPYPWMVIG